MDGPLERGHQTGGASRHSYLRTRKQSSCPVPDAAFLAGASEPRRTDPQNEGWQGAWPGQPSWEASRSLHRRRFAVRATVCSPPGGTLVTSLTQYCCKIAARAISSLVPAHPGACTSPGANLSRAQRTLLIPARESSKHQRLEMKGQGSRPPATSAFLFFFCFPPPPSPLLLRNGGAPKPEKVCWRVN